MNRFQCASFWDPQDAVDPAAVVPAGEAGRVFSVIWELGAGGNWGNTKEVCIFLLLKEMELTSIHHIVYPLKVWFNLRKAGDFSNNKLILRSSNNKDMVGTKKWRITLGRWCCDMLDRASYWMDHVNTYRTGHPNEYVFSVVPEQGYGYTQFMFSARSSNMALEVCLL